MARKRKSKPTSPRRSEEQRVRDRLSHALDDARRLDLVSNDPAPPEVSLKPEVVNPATQSEQRFPVLIAQALRHGWAVPDEKKPGLVDEMVCVVEDPEAAAVAKVMAFNALAKGDQLQHERDQEFIRVDRVLAMWRGVLDAIRTHVSDPVVLKAITDDVLRLLPVPSQT